ncbi:MAG: PQQ-dependent sugar dehydrogenase [Actinomycetota bacterium]|nr:PQQ-dependent sugar dehydrogenase [Actinomycetota bacterium]
MRSLSALAVVAVTFAGCASSETTEDAVTNVERSTAATSTAPDGGSSARLRLEEIANGLQSPVHVAVAPGEPDRLYVVEQTGAIRVLEDGRLREAPFLDVSNDIQSGGEQGLLSVAFHPGYEEDGRFFVDYTDIRGDTRVVEYRANEDRTAADPSTARIILAVEQPYSNHNGGQLVFGPDGLLYVGMGDGGSGGDPENRAQDLSDRLGKILRTDVEGPADDWEIVAYGLRNPWRFSFDRENGDLYVADVGQSSQEEINYLPSSATGLVNFGWDVFEGRLRHEEKEPNPAGRLVRPVAVYGRDGGCSVTGGFVYRGEAIPAVQGRYFYGDYCSGIVWSFRIEGEKARELRREPFTVEGLSSFGEDANGEIYLAALSGTVYRLAAR